ncbi:MAG: hypothetical protein P4L11_00480 [Geothrix sp.]|nr:hypothetical protein [Geothrix sp.]
MTKPSHSGSHPPPKSGSRPGLVRAAKVIPAMEKRKDPPEPAAAPKTNRCTGHCGHCDIHPCQLHTTV